MVFTRYLALTLYIHAIYRDLFLRKEINKKYKMVAFDCGQL
jgi:hypothetical protein